MSPAPMNPTFIIFIHHSRKRLFFKRKWVSLFLSFPECRICSCFVGSGYHVIQRRKITLKQLLPGFSSLASVCSPIGWYFLPSLVEWGVHRMAKDSGIADFSLEVSKLNPWGSELSNFRLKENQSFLEVERIHLLHDPDDLAKGELQAVSVTRLQADFQTKDLVASSYRNGRKRCRWRSPFPPFLLRDFLDDPPLTFVRIRDSSIALIHREQRFV